MKAEDVMTQHVVSVGPNDTVSRAVRLMLQNDISGLPVLAADGTLVGMITEGDLLRRAETATQRRRPRWLEFFSGPGQLAEEYVHTHGRKVSELMTNDPVTVTEATPLEQVVSRANLLHALARISGEAKPASTDDQTIRTRLLAELGNERWAPVAALDITVRDGIVDLWGTITDERERQALIVAAENIAGVKAVRDHLAWVDPMSGMLILAPDAPEELAKTN
jgi:CBS domain-containing protein